MTNLKQYRSKRDFQHTPEPAGDTPASLTDRQTHFVVHKHAARRLHYDLRLEHDGVLESWAVPKGPSLEPGVKRLAVRVEDHPLEYGEFEGVIPEGEYGAGTVMLWDRGLCEMKRRTEDRLDFVLEGHKLRGAWSLVRMTGRAGEEGRNWLLIKRSEGKPMERSSESAADVSDEASVLSGRTMEQIAARDRTWSGGGERKGDLKPEGKARKNAASGAQRVPDPHMLAGARRKSLPKAPRPQLATLVDSAPKDAEWIHEIKLDGYRILARLNHGRPTLISRNGNDWTARFPEVAAQLAQLPVKDVLLDGEVVALGADGVSSFRRLQEALSARRTAALVYHVFDLLHLNGYSLTEVALAERKLALASLLEAAGMTRNGAVRYTDQIEGRGPDFFSQACRLGLEGIVSKRPDDVYREGRSKSWLKAKCLHHAELLVGGYTEPSGARNGFGALLLGGYRDQRLVYSTKVGTGFSERQLKSLLDVMQKLEVKTSPFDPPPRERHVHWVRPELVAEVEYAEWTRDGALRYPVFRGLREDRDPDEIELPAAASGRSAAPENPDRADSDEARVAGVRLSHPDRVLYPRQGITKLALAQFYEQIADWILPGLSDRPLSLVRCPEGRERNCFLQKHPGETFPAHLPRIDIAEEEGPEPYLYVRTLADLVGLVQAGTLELHVWGSRVDDVEHPDQLVFDLDPAPDVNWPEVLQAATGLRERLRGFGLESFVRTTGGKGLHLVVPLVPKADWDEAKRFAHAIAHACAADEPQRLTANLSKAKRQGRIFVDYLRNGRGATAIASYSARAHEGAPVAVPLHWDELNPATRSDRYTIDNLKGRLMALRNDPWDGFEAARRPLTADLLVAAGAKKRRGRR